jgi:hypothetical protein
MTTEINEKTLKVIEEYIFHFLNQLDSNNHIFDTIINNYDVQFEFQYQLFHQGNCDNKNRWSKFKYIRDFHNYVKNINNNFYTYIKSYNNEFYEYLNVRNNYIEILQYVAMSYKNHDDDNELDIEKWSDFEYIINKYVSNFISDEGVDIDEILKKYEKGYEKNILK